MVPIYYNVRSLLVRKANTIATAFGIALVVFVLASSQMLANGLSKTMGRSGRDDQAIVLRKGSDAELSSGIDLSLVNQVLAAPGVQRDGSGQPVGVGEVVLILAMNRQGQQEQLSNVTVRGTTAEALALRSEVRIVEGRKPSPGTDEVLIGRPLVGEYPGMTLGGRFVLNKNREAHVVGVFEANGSVFESEIWADVDTVRSAFGRQQMVNSVTVALASPAQFTEFQAAVEGDKRLGLLAQRQSDFFEKQSEGSVLFLSILGGIIVVFFSIGAMIGAMNTMYAAVQSRRKEIGTLRALGFSRFAVMRSFVLESFVLALVGGGLGTLASLGMGAVEFSMMNVSSWSEITFHFEPEPAILVRSLLVGGLMGLLGGFFPALRAASVSPLAAMRD